MAKLTWLGEDLGDHPGPSFVIWQGVKFPKGKAVEVTDEHVLAKARGNRFFKVNEGAKPAPAKEADVKIPQTKAEPQVQERAQEPNQEPEDKTGYSPVKKKVRKPKAAHKSAHR